MYHDLVGQVTSSTGSCIVVYICIYIYYIIYTFYTLDITRLYTFT